MFIRENCSLTGNRSDVLWCDDLYSTYRAWCVMRTEPNILPRRTFISVFKDATRGRGCAYGTQRKGSATKRGFSGLTVRPVDVATAFKPALKEVAK